VGFVLQQGIAFSAVKNRPPYAIASVDSALLLATLLQQEGPMRVSDAAVRLGVSVSTAHRLLGMLVYRDFAEQLPDRRYRPGPLMQGRALPPEPGVRLRETALPHLRRLVDRVAETVNLMVLTGSDVRFLATVECGHVLRVGDRTGRTLKAHLSSGGKALLAGLPREQLDATLADVDEEVVDGLRRELRAIRRRGFAINDQQTERGLTAVGVAVPAPGEVSRAALSIAVPTVRYSRHQLPSWSTALVETAAAIAQELNGG
jgi:IclR family transcriptional regulator, acetate operon repressor